MKHIYLISDVCIIAGALLLVCLMLSGAVWGAFQGIAQTLQQKGMAER